jgi:hypothetical protein
MLTLTYRENMLDRERMSRDFDVFLKRVRRVIPGFEYVCAFERQKRGAWHAHIAVQRVLPHYVQRGVMVRSYDLLRSMWREVVGIDNGNVDVSRNKRVSRSSARLASYLSKYIGKSFGESIVKGMNSYSASGRALPEALMLRIDSADSGDALVQLMHLLDVNLRRDFLGFIEGGGFFLSQSLPSHPS